MLEKYFPTFSGWIRQRGPTWKLSTWWPSDTQLSVQHSLVRLLATAHDQRLEVPPLVSCLAREHRGGERRRLARLAKRLASGMPLVPALEQTPDVLSDEMVLAIRFGSQSGTLSSTYQQLVAHGSSSSSPSQASLSQTIVYFSAVLFALAVVLSFMMTFIAPTFKQMGVELGLGGGGFGAYTNLMAASDYVAYYYPQLLAAAIGLFLLVRSATFRRFCRRWWAMGLIRQVAQLRSAQLLRMLSLAMEAGRPLPSSLSTLARYHFDKSVRMKLLFARNEVEQGADLWTSLSDAKLLTPEESRALSSSSSNSSRTWLMHSLAAWKTEAVDRRTATLVALVHPALVLIFAGVVLWIVSAFFGFLCQLILSLA